MAAHEGGTAAAGTLHVCAVPIGNLEDASPRLRRILGEVDVIACEDTRSTGKLLGLLDVERAPGARLLAHHGHNEQAGARGIVALLQQGLDVALVSDAGTPAVNDPGVALVAAAARAGIEVVAVPGPSAVAAAVSLAGIAAEGFRFTGFLPRSAEQLRSLVRLHAQDLLVAFDAPTRVASSLAVVAEVQPERGAVLCRELTKLHEVCRRGTARELAERAREETLRGELVLVLAPMPAVTSDGPDAAHLALVTGMVADGMRLATAARLVAEVLGAPRKALYDAALAARDCD